MHRSGEEDLHDSIRAQSAGSLSQRPRYADGKVNRTPPGGAGRVSPILLTIALGAVR